MMNCPDCGCAVRVVSDQPVILYHPVAVSPASSCQPTVTDIQGTSLNHLFECEEEADGSIVLFEVAEMADINAWYKLAKKLPGIETLPKEPVMESAEGVFELTPEPAVPTPAAAKKPRKLKPKALVATPTTVEQGPGEDLTVDLAVIDVPTTLKVVTNPGAYQGKIPKFKPATDANSISFSLDPEPGSRLTDALDQFWALNEVAPLGGASGIAGWSSFSTYQRCPFLWQQKYIVDPKQTDGVILPEPAALAIGSLVHALLALHYQGMIDNVYPLPDDLLAYLLTTPCNPEYVAESQRLFQAYLFFYANDIWEPLAVELRIEDAETGQSARYDLIVRIKEDTALFPAGVYIVDHKTAGRFDDTTLLGWQNDGEIVGHTMLWERMKLGRKYGKLQGSIINLIGKQKAPQFHRVRLLTNKKQWKAHHRALLYTSSQIQNNLATGYFPQTRAACIGRYGLCDKWDLCARAD